MRDDASVAARASPTSEARVGDGLDCTTSIAHLLRSSLTRPSDLVHLLTPPFSSLIYRFADPVLKVVLVGVMGLFVLTSKE